MKVLELFAGIGACSKALERLGIEHEIVDAVEIDKYAIASFNAIHGTNFEPQDISKWDKYIEVDLIMHGSPCQDFSVAGKQAGGDIGSGTRSSLMYETIRIVGKLRPKYVIWENVKNLLSAKHRHNFDAYLETMKALGYTSYYQVLNAKDYGIPQNRERVFTFSILGEHKPFIFPEKQELEIRLKDLLDNEVEEKYYLKGYQIENIVNSNFAQKNKLIQEKDVCDTLLARDYKDPKCVQVGTLDMKGYDSMKRVYSDEGLAPTLTTMGGGNTEPKIITYEIPQTVKVRKYPVNTEKLVVMLREQKQKLGLHNSVIGLKLDIPTTKVEHWFRQDSSFAIPDSELWVELKKILHIETDEFDESIMTFEEREGVFEKANRCYCEEGISPTLTSTSADEKVITAAAMRGRYNEEKVEQHIEISNREYANAITTVQKDSLIANDYRVRKLTPKECWRLMGFSDEDFEKATKVNSNSQLYKQAGNSIVVNVLIEIFRNLFAKED